MVIILPKEIWWILLIILWIYITKGNIHHNIMIIITLWLFNIAVENGP